MNSNSNTNSPNNTSGTNITFHKDVVVAINWKDFSETVRSLAIDKLKSDKLNKQELFKLMKQPILDIHDKVIQVLLRPKEWLERSNMDDNKFELDVGIVFDLISKCMKVVED